MSEESRNRKLELIFKKFELRIYQVADGQTNLTKKDIVDLIVSSLKKLYNVAIPIKLWEDQYEITLKQARKCKDLKDVIKKKQEAIKVLDPSFDRSVVITDKEGIEDLVFGKKPRRKSQRGAHSGTKRKRSTRKRSTKRRHRRSVSRSVSRSVRRSVRH